MAFLLIYKNNMLEDKVRNLEDKLKKLELENKQLNDTNNKLQYILNINNIKDINDIGYNNKIEHNEMDFEII